MTPASNALAIHFAAIGHASPVMLTTGCVTLHDEDLELLLDYECRISASTAQELTLLAEMSAIPGFRRRARTILDRTDAIEWNESDLATCRAPSQLETAVFLYGKDRVGSESFSALAEVRLPNAYVAVSDWTGRDCRVYPVRTLRLIEPYPRECVRRFSPDLTTLSCGVVPGRRIAHGSYGDVYELRDGQVLKVFRFGPFLTTNEKKLRTMTMLAASLPESFNKRAALPREVVYDPKGGCVGYVMDAIRGKTLSDVLCDGVSRAYARELMHKLLCITLELRCLGVWIRDVSLSNFLVSADGDICAIDLDSAQFMRFRGVGMPTADYCSPQLTAESFRAEDQTYGLAALAFYICSGCPVHGIDRGKEAHFGLSPQQYQVLDNYTESCRSWWAQLKQDDRQRMFDWFTCHRLATIGELLKLLPSM